MIMGKHWHNFRIELIGASIVSIIVALFVLLKCVYTIDVEMVSPAIMNTGSFAVYVANAIFFIADQKNISAAAK